MIVMKTKLITALLFLIVIAAGAGSSYYFYTKYLETKAALDNPEMVAQTEVKALTDSLGKLMELPDEEPTVATVLDRDKLQDQPFFAKAENGDKVIIYTQASKAILYRPASNKIVEVAPIQITQPESTEGAIGKEVPEPTPTPEPVDEPVEDSSE